MVDGVEFDVVQHVPEGRHLDDCHSIRLQHRPDPVDEPAEIGDVRQHVVGVEDVRAEAVGSQLAREVAPEEFAHGPNAAFFRYDGDVPCRLDPENRERHGTRSAGGDSRRYSRPPSRDSTPPARAPRRCVRRWRARWQQPCPRTRKK